MASPAFFLALRRSSKHTLRPQILYNVRDRTHLRGFCSGALKMESLVEPSDLGSSPDDLKSRIFRLRFSKRSATNAIQRWVGEGKKVSLTELRQIARELNRAQRYKHALEISEWMVTHPEFELSDHDYAVRIDLITKVFGTSSAEEFFQGLPPAAKTAETYMALLHSYASAKQTQRAEQLYEKIKELNAAKNVLVYNEMMTLYMSTGELDKVLLVVEELRSHNITLDLFTYNLWASACAATFNVNALRSVLDEMSSDPNSNGGWRIYVSLGRIYTIVGQFENSNNFAPVEAGKSITQREWITYDFLIFLYAGLGNVEKINGVWTSLKKATTKMSSRNYSCILSSYVMAGQSEEAGKIVDEWRQSVPDVDDCGFRKLLDAFRKVGLMDKAKLLHELLSQKDCAPPNWPQ